MTVIPLTRCQFVIPFAEIHSEIGGPTAALLAKFRLPASLEEKADHYVPLLPAVRFATAAQEKQGLSEIAFRAAQRLSFDHLSDAMRIRIRHSPTLLVALQQMCRWAPVEDTNLRLWLERCDGNVKICSRLLGTEGIPHLEMSQWLQNIFVMHIVRQFAGANWTPRVIAFEASYAPSIEVQSRWPSTRFMSGQKASWIEVPIQFLSYPNRADIARSNLPATERPPFGGDVVSILKLTLPAYLDEGGPALAQVAEMVGLSIRSLQRKLSLAGLTYSSLLEQVRFNNATRLLRETENKIIDVAFSSGYADPAHFTRAFRRIAGITPREFRERSSGAQVGIDSSSLPA
ncbi:AraC family transcriptional regulator [Bradyrhizobium sp. CCBAU 51753]|uniref:helix-turn-helix transcriptional regulator n=1 Tax=Bradyrhizobium sp. CCBAU 51753 TaxID=1325100 RepID=UPI00188DC257|nr:AraC family transcriptional regulator [Bradyrhizobium sp. CCBAU 51753]QOZ29516.1 AraC family transcriptional regulator [Bradyrhizobium sp. CCBAU 51753]